MKKSILVAAMVTLSLIGCKKDKDKVSENSAPKINSLNMDETQSYTYIASDGERAKITFQNAGVDHTITINSNNTKFVLDKKDGDKDAQIYERNGVQAKLTKYSLYIIQDDQVIPLVLSK